MIGAAPQRAVRASRQLWLTLVAIVLVVGAYVLVTLGQTGKTPADVRAFVAIIGASYIVATLVVMRRARTADPSLLPTAAVLAGLGYAMIYRIDQDQAAAQFGWLLLGLGLFVLTLFLVRDHRALDAYTYTIGLCGVGAPAAADRAGPGPDHQRGPPVDPARSAHLPARRARPRS